MPRPPSQPPEDSAERFARVKEILHAALDRDPVEREAWIQRSCAGDLGLEGEVRSLLAAHLTDEFLEEAPQLVNHAARREATPTAMPARIGEFRIERMLGWGGMGVVYLAEQSQPRRRVALKVLRLDCVGETARRRFFRESEALARLHHPCIAPVYETGVATTDVGPQPYFAMEYVEGVSIREYCRSRALAARERFDLVARICDAVQHAHECGVLHRDLKPDNILIDGRGTPKVLDFGVARFDADAGEDSFHTLTGQVVGTVAYMSPEQARGAEVDERSDQYSLGVILYELLSTRLPFETRGYSVAQMMRTVAESDPFPLAGVNPELSGDAATIVHKALALDPARRYLSVGTLGEDIRRFLEGRPIQARPPTTLYQVRKLVSRHRALAYSLASVFVALVLGLGLALAGMSEARESERMAKLEGDLVLRLSHAKLLEELRERERELWPPGPARVGAIEAWLSDAEELERHLPHHQRHLIEAESYAREDRLGEFLEGSSRVPGGAEWYYSALKKLVDDLHAFYAEPEGLVAQIRERWTFSATLDQRTVDDHRQLWDGTIAEIRSSPHYDGLILEPQEGLVPLGADPDSGLHEFAHYAQTGRIPERDPIDGSLEHHEETAMVLVLVPGGEVWIGTQNQDPEGINYSVDADFHEGPPRLFELDPYFLGKYEVKQGHWERLGETNNSHWAIGEDPKSGLVTALNPVEMVDRDEALAYLKKLGCTLPTEAQWERAARGGTSTAWWFGNDWADIRGLANLGSTIRVPSGRRDLDPALFGKPWDPWSVHAPAGSFPANPFGLHDMLGNVAEWCLDDYKVYYFDLPVRAGDGLVLADGGGDFSIRGGCYYHQPYVTRVSRREELRGYERKRTHGLRAARPVAGLISYEED